tara:strand:- start:257 stop:487 length:231 start_codon:yes stop_codon:yes gene_type:complete
MGKVIQFPKKRKQDLIIEELDALGDEITMILGEIDAAQNIVIELQYGYEQLLERLCELEGIDLKELQIKQKEKDDS